MSRAADDLGSNPAVVVINPDDEVTPESFTAWLDRRQTGDPVDPGVTAAETLAEIRATAIDQLMAWPLRVTQVRGLFVDAWQHRANVTFADAIYVALAQHLGADLLTDDYRLARTPNLPVTPLQLPAGPEATR